MFSFIYVFWYVLVFMFSGICVFLYLYFLYLCSSVLYRYCSLIFKSVGSAVKFISLFLSVLSKWGCFCALHRRLFQYFWFLSSTSLQNNRCFYSVVPRALAVDLFSVNRRSENRLHTDRLAFCPHPSGHLRLLRGRTPGLRLIFLTPVGAFIKCQAAIINLFAAAQ